MEHLIGTKLTQVKKDTEEHILTLTFDHKYQVEISGWHNSMTDEEGILINDTTCKIEEEV